MKMEKDHYLLLSISIDVKHTTRKISSFKAKMLHVNISTTPIRKLFDEMDLFFKPNTSHAYLTWSYAITCLHTLEILIVDNLYGFVSFGLTT